MRLFFVNTDAVSYAGESKHDDWIGRNVVLTGGVVKYKDDLARIPADARVLVYVNKVGVVAVGQALTEDVQVVLPPDTIYDSDQPEYHKPVTWLLDLRDSPINSTELVALLGWNPRGAVQEVHKGKKALLHRLAVLEATPTTNADTYTRVAAESMVRRLGLVTTDVDVWVGSGYAYNERRVMILGESWWGDTEPLSGAIERWARDEQADATFSRLFNTCSGTRREHASYNERMAFWNSIAFYNFVQGTLGSTRESRPSSKHFKSAVPVLERVLHSLNPKGVWIVGRAQSEYSDPVLRRLNVPFEVVNHPSSGISHERFHKSWTDLLAKLS